MPDSMADVIRVGPFLVRLKEGAEVTPDQSHLNQGRINIITADWQQYTNLPTCPP